MSVLSRVALFFALAVTTLLNIGVARGEPAFCADPASHCGSDLPVACLQQSGAGAAALPAADCPERLDSYRRCLQAVAAQCAPQRPEPRAQAAEFEPFTLRCRIAEIDRTQIDRYRSRIDPGEGDTRNRRYFEEKIAAEEAKIQAAFSRYSAEPEYTVLGRSRLYDWTRATFMQAFVSSTQITGSASGRQAAEVRIDRQNGALELGLVGEGVSVRAFGDCSKIEYRPVDAKPAF